MLLAVIADIHANLEAFEAVLAAIDRERPAAVVNLGDAVGYGPDPEAVLRLLAERGIPSVRGNHEWAVADPARESRFNPQAREALARTRELLPPELVARIAAFPTSLSLYGCRFVHGLPPNDTGTYLFEAGEVTLRRAFARTAERVSFVGHTHMLEAASLAGRDVERYELALGDNPLDPLRRHIVNVGSVGQPRDGDNRAKYGLYDDVAHVLAIRAVPYDIEAVARKILARGLPPRYADRLR
ncbi:metallophosphoesterase [Solidesulfovibrio carbinoliphilus subsp. oakridgensis]|uniref:Metallophosphoesterase n=1 Tax=Solidesulfovibrio carbinoliphilus subsp. oakridgensis TaxID=694327 RepID=G7Q815_9BACT|nr:metallophosphoesterase family protein [Solidesulfovibrio carbinoliphilus]EHJ47709.1 metallophosphoesterase [Solidesulfovibrio carbinoliphilus subsp. oakridgensis]